MLVHRMVKDIKNSKVLHKIKTKDAYTAQQLYQQFKSQHLLDDRIGKMSEVEGDAKEKGCRRGETITVGCGTCGETFKHRCEYNTITKDSQHSGKSHRFRIKDDKLFKLRSMIKKMKDGGPGSGIKGHTTAEEPTKARPAAKAEEPAKSGEGKSFVSKEHAQAYINGAAKTASKLLGAGVKQGYTGFEWSKEGGYADAKMKLTRMKIEKAGFKKVDFDQADHPAGNWTRNITIFQNENGDVIKMTSRYGETSRQNSHSVAYIPKDFNKAKERLYAQDADYRGYKVTDQIIKGFMIYKSGKPNQFTAKNENGEQYEGTMEQIKKQIDAYWVKRDEDVMKQKMKDAKGNIAIQNRINELERQATNIENQFDKFLSDKEKASLQRRLDVIEKEIEQLESSKTKDAKMTNRIN